MGFGDDEDVGEYFHTQFVGDVNGKEVLTMLNDNSVRHALTCEDQFEQQGNGNDDEDPETFASNTRYNMVQFHGIMPDTGAAKISTGGVPQFKALQKIDSTIRLNKSTSGEKIKFGSGAPVTTFGTVELHTPLGMMVFHIVPTSTPFLLCLKDMDKLGITFDNLRNLLIQGDITVPVARKYGHAWMPVHKQHAEHLAVSHLTEVELRQLHRRFGHPSVRRLAKVLQRAGYEEDFEIKVLEKLTKYCNHCQLNSTSPGRFRFSLKEDKEFNYSIVVDIFYIDGDPVLHVVDLSTAFQAADFTKSMLAKDIWNSICKC